MEPVTLTESIRRLTILRQYLAIHVPRKHFDMASWGVLNLQEVGPEILSRDHFAGGDCGTAACALGHAAMIPEFQDLGISARLEYTTCQRYADIRTYKMNIYQVDIDGVYHGVNAGQKFFGLAEDQAFRIFVPNSANRGAPAYGMPNGRMVRLSEMTKEAVLDNIDFVIKEQEKLLVNEEHILNLGLTPYYGAPL